MYMPITDILVRREYLASPFLLRNIAAEVKNSTMTYVQHRQSKEGSLLMGPYRLWGSCSNYKGTCLAMVDCYPSPQEYGKKWAGLWDMELGWVFLLPLVVLLVIHRIMKRVEMQWGSFQVIIPLLPK